MESLSNQKIQEVPKKSKRNHVLDLMRGHYLTAILIDHLHKFPSIFVFYNGKGDLWVSAATGFVFISGMLIGMVNFPKIPTHGMKYVTSKLLRRGIKLHIVSIFLTVSYSLIGLRLNRWEYLNEGIKFNNFWDIFINALTFQYSYGWADLLIFYAALILISPVVIYLIYRGFWYVVFGISFVLWAYALYHPETPKISGSSFPLISWQFLFFGGIMVGYFRDKFAQIYSKFFRIERVLPIVVLTITALVLLGLSISDVFYGKFDQYERITRFIDFAFVKTELGPGRLAAFFVWFSFLYVIFEKLFGVISKYLGWLFYTFGKNSLLTYSLQSVVLFVEFYFDPFGGYWYNNFLTVAVIILVWILVKGTRKFEKVLNRYINYARIQKPYRKELKNAA